MVTAIQQTPLVRKSTRGREKLGKNATKSVEPVVFRCIRFPELRFMVGGEVILDELARHRSMRRGTWKAFHNTQYVATTAEEVEFCRSKKGVIYEEPKVPQEAFNEEGKYDPELDPRRVYAAYGADGRETFKTYNLDCWKAYQKKLNS
ncbi:MAG TPA: hypothetical protein VLA89_06735 [Gemmatimonadales bacterium]|nr:hypothetical protein [Gemmatimonadales bacterium]